MIDTSDTIKPEYDTVLRIFATLDLIEFKTDKLAHEIPEISENLEKWNNKLIKDTFFLNFLYKFCEVKGF